MIHKTFFRKFLRSFGYQVDNVHFIFVYNNSYQTSIKMENFEVLYGRPRRSPLCWVEVGKKVLFGLDFMKEAKLKVEIRKRLLTTQTR